MIVVVVASVINHPNTIQDHVLDHVAKDAVVAKAKCIENNNGPVLASLVAVSYCHKLRVAV